MIDEKIWHAGVKKLRHSKSEGKRWVILVGLDRIDRLTRHSEPARKLTLAPTVLFSVEFDPVFQNKTLNSDSCL